MIAGGAAAALMLPLTLAACSSNNASTSTSTASTTAPAPVNAGATVSITDFAYGPETVTVKKGETITWKNDGAAKHTVTSDDDTLKSPNLSAGSTDTYVKSFDTPGEYAYFCSVHGKDKMAGKIIVQ